MKPTFFSSDSEFREWLKKNHKTEMELIVGFYKVASQKPSMTWSQSVDQALCFGWIDGVRRSIDQESYYIRFTPRRSNSIWSAINIKKVGELTKLGLMTKYGHKAYSLRTESKSKIYSHEKEQAELDITLEMKFKRNKKAWEFFIGQAPSYKKVIVHWIMTAKQEATRHSRLTKVIDESACQRRIK